MLALYGFLGVFFGLGEHGREGRMKTFSRITVLSLVFVLGLGRTAQAGDLPWLSNYNQASEEAAQKNKPIYLLFVNGHSCPRCTRFEESISSKEKFARFAKDNLILLMVDYGPYFETNRQVSFFEIERAGEIPKDFWMKGRGGPWPYLFLISPSNEISYSGSAFGNSSNPSDYMTFLESNLKFEQSSP